MNGACGDDGGWLSVVVSRVTDTASNTRIIELTSTSESLPDYEAGAHIAVRCDGLVRHYSLFGPMVSPSFYRIAVKRELQSRGGSKWLFEAAVPGASLTISKPRNNFPLIMDKSQYLFIAGGIGVTPILAMLQTLRKANVRTRLVHLCRSPEDFAFAEHLDIEGAHHDVHFHFDSQAGGVYDILKELQGHDAATEIYCCGPTPLMNAVQDFADKSGRSNQFHFEFFSAEPIEKIGSDSAPGFLIIAQKSDKRIEVHRNESVLAALRKTGIEIESECEDGVCGTCVVRVLEGTPDHRDFVLTRAERDSGDRMATCVSRSKTPQIVLDI